MAVKFLDNTGLGYFWGKIKAWCSSTFAAIAHTHTSYAVKHSYTTAANAAKNWYRIANANTSQLDTTKPIRAQFIVTAYNTSYAADYYETWFVNAIVFGRQAHIVIFGGSGVPFSQARILYENTVADIDANDRPAIDLYLNYVLPNGTTKIEVEEIYNNGGWTFVADGQLAASTIPSGFESIASAPRNTGVNNSTYADYVNYLNRQISNITAAFTLADSYLYRSRTLNCTGTFTITIPSISSGYMWCVIKNKNTSSGVITLHPSTTSVLIDGSNADITLQPMEYVCIHSAGANNYSLIADGRFSIKTVASAKSVSTENPSTHTKLFYTVGQPAVGTTAGKAYEGSSSDYSLLSFPTNGTVHNTSANIQNLRLMWINSTTYFTDIFVSPNNHYIWHRDVMSSTAYGWRRLVEENVTGVTAPTWDISIGGNAATASAVAWSGVTNKPTTLAGYGITDAKIANGTITLGSNSITPLTSHQTLPTLSRTISGSGNAITDITVSNHAITATKGTTFLTSHQSLVDYAKLASPAFTGTPTAPTAAASTNNTQIATTAFVKAQGYLTSVSGTAGTSLLAWNTENTVYTIGGHAIKVKLPANPNTNTTYTFATGDSNGQIKVTPSGGSAQNVSVKGLGSAAYTESSAYATSGHTHSYLPLSGGTLTGALTGTAFVYKSTNIDRADTTTDSSIENWVYTYRDKNNNDIGDYGVNRYPKNGSDRHRFRLRNTNNAWADLIFEFKDNGQYFLWMTGSSGTTNGGFSGNITGNAATATKATQDGNGNTITSTYVAKAGDTMTGNLWIMRETYPVIGQKATADSTGIDYIHQDKDSNSIFVIRSYTSSETQICRKRSDGGTWYEGAQIKLSSAGSILLRANNGTKSYDANLNTDGSLNCTFTSLKMNGSYYNRNPNVTKGTNPASDTTYFWSNYCYDKNGTNYANSCLGLFETSLSSDGTVRTYMRALENTASSSNNMQFACVYDKANNRKYAECNSEIKITSNSQNQLRMIQGNYGVFFRNDGSMFYILLTDSGSATYGSWTSARPLTINLSTGVCNINGNAATATKLATARTINGVSFDGSANITVADSTKVAKTGDTMTGNLVIKKSGPLLVFQNTDYTKGTKPNGTKYNTIPFVDTAGTANANRIAFLEAYVDANGKTCMQMSAYKYAASGTANGTMGICYDMTGTAAYTFAPTPATADDSTKIATTAFVKAQGYVTLSGAQNITGAKRFVNSIGMDFAEDYYNHNPTTNVYRSLNVKEKTQNTTMADILYANNSGDSATWILRLGFSAAINSYFAVYESRTDSYCLTYFDLIPSSSGNTNCGRSSRKWNQVWATTGTIQTSDKRLKEDIIDIPDTVLDVWENVSWKQFKFKKSVKEKGSELARIHSGIIAQDVQELFNKVDIDCGKYGFFCYDEWDAEEARYDDDGNLLIPGIEADNQYSVRYEEALCIEAAYQRRKNKILENRISELENQLSSVLQTLKELKGVG